MPVDESYVRANSRLTTAAAKLMLIPLCQRTTSSYAGLGPSTTLIAAGIAWELAFSAWKLCGPRLLTRDAQAVFHCHCSTSTGSNPAEQQAGALPASLNPPCRGAHGPPRRKKPRTAARRRGAALYCVAARGQPAPRPSGALDPIAPRLQHARRHCKNKTQ